MFVWEHFPFLETGKNASSLLLFIYSVVLFLFFLKDKDHFRQPVLSLFINPVRRSVWLHVLRFMP